MKLLLLALVPLFAFAETPRSPEAAFDRFVEVTSMASAIDKTNNMQLDAMISQNPGKKAMQKMPTMMVKVQQIAMNIMQTKMPTFSLKTLAPGPVH